MRANNKIFILNIIIFKHFKKLNRSIMEYEEIRIKIMN